MIPAPSLPVVSEKYDATALLIQVARTYQTYQSNKLWNHLSLAQCLKAYSSWSNVALPDARSFSLDLKRLKLCDEAWIMLRVLSITLEILSLLLLEMLLLVLMLLLPATGISHSLFAEFCTTLIRLSTAFLMFSLRWVFAAIFSSVLIWTNES